MAQELASAMDRGELKKLLMKSKKEPVNCAVGMGDGKKSQPGLILLDRVKAPKAVLKELEKQFPDATNTRWGSAFVDTDLDAALVQLQLNKPGVGDRQAAGQVAQGHRLHQGEDHARGRVRRRGGGRRGAGGSIDAIGDAGKRCGSAASCRPCSAVRRRTGREPTGFRRASAGNGPFARA